MKPVLGALASKAGSWDAVVWAGIGHGADLEAVRSLGGRQCYIEPHPALRRRIEARLGTDPGASVDARPLWSTQGKHVFHLANDAVSSTLLPPAKAWVGRPNLRAIGNVEVETRSLAALLDDMSLQQDASALLILDIGGGEEELLAASGERVLRRISHILIPARCEPAVAHLQAHGYDNEANEAGWYLLARPAPVPRDFAKEVEQLMAEQAARSEELGALTEGLERANREIEALGKSHAELAADRDKALESLSAALRERDDALAGRSEALREREDALAERSAALLERDDALGQRSAALSERDDALSQRSAALSEREELAASIASLQERATGLEGARAAADSRTTALQQKLTDFSQEAAGTIAALTKERDTAIGSLVEKTALAERLQAAHGELQARAERLETELLEARKSLALSIKLQAQRDADLADLQERYRESQEVQENQRNLLERLGERLGEASRYFHQLADEREKD